jgi:hypothetical protein
MDPEPIILLCGLSSFPIYVAYREGVSGERHAEIWSATEISVLLILTIFAIITKGQSPFFLYGYGSLIGFSYWRLFQLRNSNHNLPLFPLLAWPLGIALIVSLVFFYVSLNRYAFVRESEHKIVVYDKLTGKHY